MVLNSDDNPTIIDVSVVSPVFNNVETLYQLIERTCKTLRNEKISFEYLLVDDGSSDNSYEIISSLSNQFSEVIGIKLPKNRGQHVATLTGIKHTTGEIIITMDADLQVNPEDIPELLRILKENPDIDVASGNREFRSHRRMRSFFSYIISFLLNRMCHSKLKDLGSTFKAMRRSVIDFALENEIMALNLPLFVAYNGFQIKEVQISYNKPLDLRGNYKVSHLIYLFMSVIINYSSGVVSLAWIMVLGLFLISFGFLIFTGLTIHAFFTIAPLRTNVLLAGIYLMLFGGHFVAISFIGYKLEVLRRDLNLFNSPSFHPSSPKHKKDADKVTSNGKNT